MVRHLRKPGHPRRRRLVSYRPPVRSITPRQPPGRSASLPLSSPRFSLSIFSLFASSSAFFLPPLPCCSPPRLFSSFFFFVECTFLFLLLLRDSFSSISFCVRACVYSTGEPFHHPPPSSSSSPRLARRGCSLLLRLRLEETGERERETLSLSKLAATDSPLAGNGETVHHVRLKSVTTLSPMPGLHDQLHFQRGPTNYPHDCFRSPAVGPPDK